MSVTGLDVFDTTVSKTNAWLKRLMEIMDYQDRRVAYRGMRATLHAVRDRLTVEEVAQLAAQLPMLMRGFYYEGWDPTAKPLKVRQREAFLDYIQREMTGDEPVDPGTLARAVFQVLAERVADGEIEDVKQLLPEDIREMWTGVPATTRAERP
jgi:uncharacterized protein (DUF2267 family)